MVISASSKEGVNFIFTNAVRAHLGVNAADCIEVEQLPEAVLIHPPENFLVVLTVASYVFRLFVVFHLNGDKQTTEYFTNSSASVSLTESFSEIGNLCCGAMNRELGKYFLHMGMSTPHQLESKSFQFLGELRPGYVSQFKIQINKSLLMHATLGLCAYAPIDFCVDKTAAPEATGELELF